MPNRFSTLRFLASEGEYDLVQPGSSLNESLLSPTGGAVEELLSHLDVAGHSDLCVSLQPFVE
jgi:hypothetical protein